MSNVDVVGDGQQSRDGGQPILAFRRAGHVRRDESGKRVSGEVAGNTVLIYDENVDEALQTLRHELIDHIVTSEVVEPLVGLINLLVKQWEREIYERKEELVKRLCELV